MGNLAVAQSLLDQVRTRAKLAKTGANSKSDLQKAIDLERRLELQGEGHRWLDLLRTGQAISVMNEWFATQKIPTIVTAKYLLLPIPQGQINTDPAIKQNDGY